MEEKDSPSTNSDTEFSPRDEDGDEDEDDDLLWEGGDASGDGQGQQRDEGRDADGGTTVRSGPAQYPSPSSPPHRASQWILVMTNGSSPSEYSTCSWPTRWWTRHVGRPTPTGHRSRQKEWTGTVALGRSWQRRSFRRGLAVWYPTRITRIQIRSIVCARNYDHLRNFDFFGPGVVSCLVKKKKKNAGNSPKLARQIAMPSCRPPLLASWIKKEFLCGSFYGQVMLESVWTKEDDFLCFTRLKLFECSTKKLTGLTILLLCTWRKRGENNSKMFQKNFA